MPLFLLFVSALIPGMNASETFAELLVGFFLGCSVLRGGCGSLLENQQWEH